VSGVSPDIHLNLQGGTNLSISGENFPHNLETSTVEIKFNDDQETACVAQVSSTSELVCLTSAFHYSQEGGVSIQMTILINGLVAGNPTVTLSDENIAILSLTPSSVSPVLKTKIVVQIDSSFPYTLAREDITMNAISTNDSSYIRYLRVIEVDDAAKTFTALFGGAYSGEFEISVRHSVFGILSVEGHILDVSGTVTSYTPMSGSIYGGTLLTITGTNFGSEFTDNPV
jgi:hypothetical protein